MMRIKASGGHSAMTLLAGVLPNLRDAHILTLAIGLAAIAFLLLARRQRWSFPATLPLLSCAWMP